MLKYLYGDKHIFQCISFPSCDSTQREPPCFLLLLGVTKHKQSVSWEIPQQSEYAVQKYTFCFYFLFYSPRPTVQKWDIFSTESYLNTTLALQLYFLCLFFILCQLIQWFPSGVLFRGPLFDVFHILLKITHDHLHIGMYTNIYISYLSLAKTMTLLKRNKCLSLVFEPSVT